MQTCAPDSPQAAAKIVALTMLADGDIGQDELALLDRLQLYAQLDLSRDEMFDVMSDFCRSALGHPPSCATHGCPLDECEVARLMAQITHPWLRVRLLRLCLQMAEADGRVEEGEVFVLNAAVEHWGLHREMLETANDSVLAKAA
jgi:Tellurite resistance protein TerB